MTRSNRAGSGTVRRVAGAAAGAVVAALRGTVTTALDLVLPRTCPGCHADEAWCAACAATLSGRPRAVTLSDALLDRFAASRLPVPSVHALARYGGPPRAAIIAGKERGRRDLPPLLGAALGRGIGQLQDSGVLPPEVWLVPAPTRRSAARARGGDPVLAMARAAAQLLAGPGRPTGVAPCLFTARGVRDSVGLDAAARSANLAHAVRFDGRAAPPSEASLLLLDDVLTSGATMLHSALALRSAGWPCTGVLVVTSVLALRPTLLHTGRVQTC